MTTPDQAADGYRLFPVNILREGSGFAVAFKSIPPEAFTDPFVAETTARFTEPPIERRLETIGDARGLETIAPRGIIYHVSKCGSTLVSQLLKRLDDIIVYSQPDALNDLLMPPHASSAEQLIQALRALGALFADHARRPYVLKLESWNVLYCRLLQQAFPATPSVFCIRDPIDVAVSVMEDPDPGVWYRHLKSGNNPFFAQFGLDAAARLAPGDYIALFYTRFCAAIRQLEPQSSRIIRYDGMPESIWRTVAPAFNLPVPAAALARMQQAAEFYSKDPLGTQRTFVADSTGKRQRVAADVSAAIDAVARPAYEQMLLMASGTAD
ncbi:conserved hypothetical protein [Bradyrhizobium sp. STM 3843]|uniref:sulfotransferase family protein n=1 Tax=Bradyrhizobium sp. STM 3843 TaxID=551947 RepID=UPI0002404FB5|nr:sulfotransferase family protein [Bradyrhizobium sp. STM 3843]CCE09336.1 conserved hypothetical protein [Bradyrhizobium sp. STM 3843]